MQCLCHTYHCSNTLHPNVGEDRQYGQLYIIEGDQAVRTRMNSIPNSSCTYEIMQIIQTIIDHNSPYVAAYKYVHAMLLSKVNNSVHLLKIDHRGPDQRCYNEPTHDKDGAHQLIQTL